MQEVNNVQSGAEGDRGNDQVDNEMWQRPETEKVRDAKLRQKMGELTYEVTAEGRVNAMRVLRWVTETLDTETEKRSSSAVGSAASLWKHVKHAARRRPAAEGLQGEAGGRQGSEATQPEKHVWPWTSDADNKDVYIEPTERNNRLEAKQTAARRLKRNEGAPLFCDNV